jgi:hypothetical protein
MGQIAEYAAGVEWHVRSGVDVHDCLFGAFWWGFRLM